MTNQLINEEKALREELAAIKAREKEIRSRLKVIEEAKRADEPQPEEPVNTVILWDTQGTEALKSYLVPMDLAQLKAVARANCMTTGMTSKNPQKWVEHILFMSKLRATQGDVFRNVD